METSDSFLSSDRERFEAEVRSRSWAWLLALRRRLNVDLQIVDDEYLPTLESIPQSTILTELLTSGAGPLRSAIFASMRNSVAQSVTIDTMQFACFAVTGEAGARGALVLARSVGPQRSAEQTRAELEIIGPWLCSAIEAHLQAPPITHEAGLARLSTLARVLDDLAPTSSDRELVARFADVLAVWHDLEVSGYVETADGAFRRGVTLPGVDRTMIPALIQPSALPDDGDLSVLSKGDGERLGFANSRDVLVVRLNRERGSWLLVFGGPVDAQNRRQLNAYVTLLDQCMARATATAVARVVSAMAVHLLDQQDRPEVTAARAVGELGRALAATSLSLNVASPTGVSMLRVGAASLPDAGGWSEVRRDALYTATLTISPSEDRAITPHEQQIVRAAADLLEPWVASVVRRPRSRSERRGGSARDFDQVMDRFADQALERGVPVTAMVVSVAGDPDSAVLTRRWIGQLRGQLRAADMVGLLAEGEIGLLLDDTSTDQAHAIAARLQSIIAASDEVDASIRTSIGFATRVPGDVATRAIVREARERALRDVS